MALNATDILGDYKDASGTVKATGGRLYGVAVFSTSTAGGVIIRDGGVSGTIKLRIVTLALEPAFAVILIPHFIICATDIYCELSNTMAAILYK